MRNHHQHSPKIAENADLLVLDKPASNHQLLVWNDDVNTFEWVIHALIDICGHSQEQAEQCALLIHHKGKYAVKKGSYEFLEPQCEAINNRNINATIEMIV